MIDWGDFAGARSRARTLVARQKSQDGLSATIALIDFAKVHHERQKNNRRVVCADRAGRR